MPCHIHGFQPWLMEASGTSWAHHQWFRCHSPNRRMDFWGDLRFGCKGWKIPWVSCSAVSLRLSVPPLLANLLVGAASRTTRPARSSISKWTILDLSWPMNLMANCGVFIAISRHAIVGCCVALFEAGPIRLKSQTSFAILVQCADLSYESRHAICRPKKKWAM